VNWRDRIIVDPAIHHGGPCIKGTRVPVSVIAYPQLTPDDIRAAMQFLPAKS
jgi:uncharacterized protein (DUF433 family)